jgi:hypothetical protein
MRKLKAFVGVGLSLLIISCEEILLEQDITNKTVEIIAPAGGTVVGSPDVTFNWTALEGASFYHLQIATPDFVAPQQLITDSIVEGNFYFQELTENEYEWRVNALNSGYHTSYASAPFGVNVPGDFSDQHVNLYSPSDNYLSQTRSVALNWEEIENATVYRIQILKEGQLVDEKTTAQTNFQMEMAEGEFIWRVRAENEFNTTFYSERNIFIDTEKPNTPQLLNPVDNLELSTTAVAFQWFREEINGSDEVDSLFIFKDIELNQLVEKDQVTTSHSTILERGETYYWLMKSYDAAGNIGDQSSVFSFSIE